MTQLTKSKSVLTYRTYRKARDRALIRLSHLYPDTYKQLLAIERSFDEQEGKTWSITPDARLTVGIHTRANSAPPFGDPADAGEDEGNYGGEA